MTLVIFPRILRQPEPDAAPAPVLRYGPPLPGGRLLFPLRITRQPEPEFPQPLAIRHGPPVIDYGPRAASFRGLYRIFNAAVYRFYWSTSAPPVPGTSPQATNATLAYTTPATFADGTYYVSVSYFDGVLDSGFLPVGPQGQTYLTVVISGGVLVPNGPSQPSGATLNVLAGGVIQIVAYYNAAPDVAAGVARATTWAIAYTTNGSTPPDGSPNVTQTMGKGAFQILSYSLPAQANGTTVKVELQTYNGSAYSSPLPVMTAVASTAGPSAPLGLQSWPGALPQEQ